jgi:amidase
MRFFGQEIFELSQSTSGDLRDPEYLKARALCLELGRDKGIDRALAKHNLDAILSPSYAFGTSGPAVAGYPLISVPVGISSKGRPAGIWLSGGFLSEPKLIALAYAIEQLLDARTPPRFRGDLPPKPPNAGICSGLNRAQGEGAGTGDVLMDQELMRRVTRQRPSF